MRAGARGQGVCFSRRVTLLRPHASPRSFDRSSCQLLVSEACYGGGRRWGWVGGGEGEVRGVGVAGGTAGGRGVERFGEGGEGGGLSVRGVVGGVLRGGS